jgi:hypothetical protein
MLSRSLRFISRKQLKPTKSEFTNGQFVRNSTDISKTQKLPYKKKVIEEFRKIFKKSSANEAFQEMEKFDEFNTKIINAAKKNLDLKKIKCLISHAWDENSENIFTHNLGIMLKESGFEVLSDQNEDITDLKRLMSEFSDVTENTFIIPIFSKAYRKRLSHPFSGVQSEFYGFENLVLMSSVNKLRGKKLKERTLYISYSEREIHYRLLKKIPNSKNQKNKEPNHTEIKGEINEKDIGDFDKFLNYLQKLNDEIMSNNLNRDALLHLLKKLPLSIQEEFVIFSRIIDKLVSKKETPGGIDLWLESDDGKNNIIPVLLQTNQETDKEFERITSPELHNIKYIEFSNEKKHFPSFYKILTVLCEKTKLPLDNKYPEKSFDSSLFTDSKIQSNFFKAVSIALQLTIKNNFGNGKSEHPGLLPRYPYFTGREKELSTIAEILKKQKSCYIIDNTKKGGRTFLANQFAYKGLDEEMFYHVFWIESSNLNFMKKDFKSIIDNLLTNEEDSNTIFGGNLDEQGLEMYFSNFLTIIPDGEKALLVYDNLDHLNFIKNGDLLPDNDRVYSLFIPDNEEDYGKIKKEKICSLTEDEGWPKKYLEKILNGKEEETEENLKARSAMINETKGHPLILYKLASFYVYEKAKNKDICFHQLFPCDFLKKTGIPNNNIDSEIDYLHLLTYEFIKRYYSGDELFSKISLPILYFSSFIGRQRIHRNLISRFFSTEDNDSGLRRAIAQLKEIKLLDRDRANNEKYFVMYHHTQKAVLTTLIPKLINGLSDNFTLFDSNLNMVINFMVEQYNNKKNTETELDEDTHHVETLLANIDKKNTLQKILNTTSTHCLC